MTSGAGRLSWRWEANDNNGRFAFELHLPDGIDAVEAVLSVSLLARLKADAQVTGATFRHRLANHHEFSFPAASKAARVIEFVATGLSFKPAHVSDGPKSGYLTLGNGRLLPLSIDPEPVVPAEPPKTVPNADTQFGVIPMPAQVQIGAWHDGQVSFRSDGTAEEAKDFDQALSLATRLFPDVQCTSECALALTYQRVPRFDWDYQIEFKQHGACLTYATSKGRLQGLITLFQLCVARTQAPETFKIPAAGYIQDRADQDWRGCHLDVARHFRPAADLSRFIDILAWLKFNVLHLHLTDDEGWRLEIPDLPMLTEIGAWRGPNLPLKGQHGFLNQGYGGFYSSAEMDTLVAHALALGVDIMPEIDTPGHCYAALVACPWLADPVEPIGAYTSFQGYPNNALNPGVPAVETFMEQVFDELARRFPMDTVHVGGDELADDAWAASPLARALAKRQGLNGTKDLFGYFLGRLRLMLHGAGKKMAVWDDAALTGAVAPGDALVFAWQDAANLKDLCAAGHQVIATPGQTYYLDMAQSSDWDAPGLHWGGTVPPKTSYDFNARALLAGGKGQNLKGVQASIWSENLTSKELFDYMVFPRLGCIAEAGWSDPSAKNWTDFQARVCLMPTLSGR